MEKKKNKPKEQQEQESSKQDIDSGEIFTELQNTYKNYAPEFLRNNVWDAYRDLVRSVPIISFPGENDIDPKDYLKTQERLYKQSISGELINGLFPFHTCYVFYEGGEPAYLGYFEHRYKVKQSDPNFDLFFTLKILQTDIMVLENFLAYQLNKSFENDHAKFYSFLKAVCSKYSELLEEKYIPLIVDFMDRLLQKNDGENSAPSILPEPILGGYTLNQQVLFMYYLLKKAGVDIRTVVPITDISRIVQGITSRQIEAKDISNTGIYKRLKNPLKDTTGTLKNDLKFVRSLFEKLSLSEVVDEINKEITDKD